MAEILAVRNIIKTFGEVRAVDGVSFTVRRGTITGLLGRNGAGKTTTIRMITGIFLPDGGKIEWLGGQVAGSGYRDHIGYLPEERGLYKQMKIVELLLFLAEIKGCRAADVKPKIDHWLERFELTEKRDAKVEELSKGNQQKVQLIGTLLHDPDLIILDEPQSGLDPVNMVIVRNLLQDLRNEGKTILLSTHMMAEAEKMADEIVLIHQGKVVLQGTLDQVRGSHGKNTLHLEFDGDGTFLSDLPDVARASVLKNSAELSLSKDADPQRILEACMPRVRLRRFEVANPSLEQIFIEKVGAETLSNEVTR
ncbi:MAG TPA: ATP-binding cassette domain-containing protein [Thermoanaerobaculia bacterium]|jgi:ABC-2 type transport system ATP-binding protein|nr:ATP-binding cassette domain-containing protein [Thermoanaerobaculia bacterium]